MKNTFQEFRKNIAVNPRGYLTVLALPKLSRSGLASRICSVIRLLEDLFTAARYYKMKRRHYTEMREKVKHEAVS